MSSDGQKSWRDYLRTAHWRAVRLIALDHADCRCALCGASENLEIHHNNYDCKYRETLADVTVLCRKCHSSIHVFLREQGRGPCYMAGTKEN